MRFTSETAINLSGFTCQMNVSALFKNVIGVSIGKRRSSASAILFKVFVSISGIFSKISVKIKALSLFLTCHGLISNR